MGGEGRNTRRGGGLRTLVASSLPALVAAAAGAEELPDEWYVGGAERPAALRAMEGRPAPPIELEAWHGPPLDIDGRITVIQFWATWSAESRASLEVNRRLHARLAPEGVALLAVHASRTGDPPLEEVIDSSGIDYPVGVDAGGVSERAWNVRAWPTYAVLDRHRVVRAIGLRPRYVERVVVRLLDEARAEDEARWLERVAGDEGRYAALMRRETPPPLDGAVWVKGDETTLADLAGKVVLLVFWRPTPPSIIRLKTAIGTHNKYAERGLAIIAVGDIADPQRGRVLAGDFGLPYRVCVDTAGAVTAAYRVDSYPDYFLVDRAGRLRFADVRDDAVEEVIRVLLDEPPPDAPRPDPR